MRSAAVFRAQDMIGNKFRTLSGYLEDGASASGIDSGYAEVYRPGL
jgi:hypothetical protein